MFISSNKKTTHFWVADVQIFVAPALMPVKFLSSEFYLGHLGFTLE
jgi:hypothetical protein